MEMEIIVTKCRGLERGNKSKIWINKDSDWFIRTAMKKVGNGRSTKFWTNIWVGDQPLCVKFPRLFSISMQQDEVVGNTGSWGENQWRWNLQWRRNLFQWEKTICRQLEQLIVLFHPLDQDDCWHWRENLDDGFTVKSCYELLCADSLMVGVLEPWQESVFSNVWKCPAPSKVCAFSWQLLLNRIATKDNLWKRRMIDNQQISCVHCGVEVETTAHLFLHCASSSKDWHDILKWLGLIIVTLPNLAISFAAFVGHATDKRSRKTLVLIWNAIMWVMWKSRNDRVFNDKVTTT
ncbi:hypothetical protein QL285_051491 [Trifolium repens]|nr:hypothetical protein QL285_051491 [Trifolium repens]